MEIAGLPERIANRIVYVEETGCEIYTGYTNKDGYAQVKYEGRVWLAHRLRWHLEVGPLDPEMTLDHLKDDRGPCRYRNCTCLAHLEPVSRSVNSQRVITANEQKTHCRRGHDYAVHGIYRVCGDGRRRRYCTLCEGGKWKKDGCESS